MYKRTATGKTELTASTTEPPSLDASQSSERGRITPPKQAFDYLPDLMAQTEQDFQLRKDIKPLHVIQPDGVSFKMDGNVLEWQNWRMHIGIF